MNSTEKSFAAVSDETARAIQGLHGVGYQTTDVQRAADFHTRHLDFTLEHQQLLAFAVVSIGDFKLLLSGPGASADRAFRGSLVRADALVIARRDGARLRYVIPPDIKERAVRDKLARHQNDPAGIGRQRDRRHRFRSYFTLK